MAEDTGPSRFTPSFSTDYNTLKEQRLREREFEDRNRISSAELWDTVRESEWMVPRLNSNKEFRETGMFSTAEEDRYLSQDELAERLGTDYSQSEYDLVADSTSQEDYNARIEKIDRDRKISQRVANEGIRGISYTFLAGMADPALFPLYLGTGGLGAAGKAGLMARSLRAGGLGAAEGAAVEAVLASADTQRDWKDIILSGAASGIVSGSVPLGIAGIRRAVDGKQRPINQRNMERNQELLDEAREVDRVNQEWAKDLRDGESVKLLQDNLSIQTLQTIPYRQNLIDELMPIAKKRMSRGDREPLKQEYSGLRNQLDQLRKEAANAPRPERAGTARQRRAAASARQQRISELEARMRPIQQRMDEIDRVIEEDLPAQDAWEDISRLANGQVPVKYRERFEQMQQEDISPMNRNESRRVREAAQRLTERKRQEADAEADAALRRPEGEEQADTTNSVGAARVAGARDPQDAYPESGDVDTEEILANMESIGANLPKRDWIRKLAGAGIKKARSAYSDLTNSNSNIIKGLAHSIIADPQYQARGHLSVSQRLATYQARLMRAEGGRESVARDAWAKEQGISRTRLHLMEEDVARDFDDMVVLEIRGIDQGSPAIKQAAEARRDLLSEALKIRKEAGESGFEEVDDSAAYWSLLHDSNKMRRASARYGADEVIETLTGSYMNGRFKLNERTARLVAKGVYHRTMRRNLSQAEATKTRLSKAEVGDLRADMEEMGFDPKQIDEFLEEMENTELQTGISNRAKLSLGASQTYQSQSGLRMVDLIDTSSRVSERYAQEAAAGAAMARSGFKSRTRLERTIDEAEKTSINAYLDGLDSRGLKISARLVEKVKKGKTVKEREYVRLKDGKEEVVSKAEIKGVKGFKEIEDEMDQLSQEASDLRDLIKLIYGETLDTDSSAFIQASRGMRKVTNLVTLQWNGFPSMGEVSNQLVNMGVGTTMRNTRFKDFASIGKIRESKDLQAFGNIVGAYGQYGASIKDNNFTLQTIDEYNQGRLERIFNNTTGWLSNKSQLLSGFRSVQHGWENVLLRSMQDRLIRISKGEIQPSQRDFDEMERAGLKREQIDEIFDHIRNNPEFVEIEGKRMQIFSGEGVRSELFEDMSAAFTTMLSRNMQRSFVGETPIWMSKELGKMATQHRTFSIASIEKQLAAGLRGDTIGMFLKLSFATAIATGAYSSRAYIRASLAEDPDEAWERYTNPYTFTTGVVNMMPQTGLMGLGMEVGFLSGAIDSEGSSMASRSGSVPISLEAIVPSLGVATDAATAGRDLFSGAVARDGEKAAESAKDVLGMMPLINSTAIGTAWAIANKSVE